MPARGRSKSLLGKNVLPLGGIPLITHTTRTAHAASTVTRVAASTGDTPIAAIARGLDAGFEGGHGAIRELADMVIGVIT